MLAIFGWSYEFKENGTGIYHFWEGSQKENYSFEFEWNRINENSINIKDNRNSVWETIEYKMENVLGSYNSKQFKLTELSNNDFWNSAEPLFKRQ